MADTPVFEPFGIQHLGTLALLLLLGAVIVTLSRKAPPRREAIGKGLGFLLAAYALTAYVQKGLARELSWQTSLPLELCHCVLIACLISLFRTNRTASEIAYFWGLGGTLQATLTPDIHNGFPSWEFVQFFWSHGAMLLAIVFLVAARDFAPRAGSVGRMFILVNCYAVVVGFLDAVFGWNYGYLCSKPFRPSLLDHLGPWPWYLLSLEGIALLSFWLADLPWRFLRKRLRAKGSGL